MVPVVIIGAGPAGIAAAVQLRRLGRDFVIFERRRAGGLLVNACLVENYPGFPDGIPGPSLAALMAAQLSRHLIAVEAAEAVTARPSEGGFTVRTASSAVEARSLIVASGTLPRTLEPPVVPAGIGDRVLYEVDPIRDVDRKRIVIVGAGDAAFDYALTLEARNRVVILNRARTPRCIPVLAERARRSGNVEHLAESRLERARASGTGLALDCAGPTGTFTLEADHLLLAVGRRPNLSLLTPDLAAMAGRPSRWPLFFVGDVARGGARQAALAVGDGVEAAVRIHAALTEIGQ